MISKPPPFKQVYPDITEEAALPHVKRLQKPSANWMLLQKYFHSRVCNTEDLRLMLSIEANRRRFTSMGSYPRQDIMRRIITRLAKLESIRLRKLLGMGGLK